jgi:phospholipase D1/2
VKIKLAARYGSQGAVTQFWFTHHQKSVILDAEGPDHKRKIVAYIGGLDLCDGRYDTPTHSLFRTLSGSVTSKLYKETCSHDVYSPQGVHKNDFHNVWEITQEYGPRQPWHDIHSFVEGPAARDVLENFLMRWEKQADKYLSVLYDIKHDPELLSYEEEVLDLKQKHKEKEMFNVQVRKYLNLIL